MITIKNLIKECCDGDNRHKHADKISIKAINDWYAMITRKEVKPLTK